MKFGACVRLSSSLCVLLGVVAATGCATLEVQDRYIPTGESKHKGIGIRDGRVVVGFEPARRFSSFGTLGLPAIPSLARADPANEIVLSVEMMLQQHHDFAFASSVCMEGESPVSLCSEQVLIHAVAWRRDHTGGSDRARSPATRIEAFFYPTRPYYIVITPEPGAAGIGPAAIYPLYGYQGEPEWTSFSAQILYRFRCRTQCPERVAVSPVGLVRVDEVAVTGPVLEFHRVRRRNYQPLATQ